MADAADRSDGIRVSDEPGGDGIRVRGGNTAAPPRAAESSSRGANAEPRQGTASASSHRRRRESSDEEDGSLSLGEVLLCGATVFVLVALAARVQNLYTVESVVGNLFGGSVGPVSSHGGEEGPKVRPTELPLRISLAEAYTGVTREVSRPWRLSRQECAANWAGCATGDVRVRRYPCSAWRCAPPAVATAPTQTTDTGRYGGAIGVGEAAWGLCPGSPPTARPAPAVPTLRRPRRGHGRPAHGSLHAALPHGVRAARCLWSPPRECWRHPPSPPDASTAAGPAAFP